MRGPWPQGQGAAALEFADVHFGYNPQREILKGVSFAIPPGGNLAVVGPTGPGSRPSPACCSVSMMWASGSIRIGGEDIRDLTQDSLRAAIGVVPQDTVLFNDTIRYNIAYGRPSGLGRGGRGGGAARPAARLHPRCRWATRPRSASAG